MKKGIAGIIGIIGSFTGIIIGFIGSRCLEKKTTEMKEYKVNKFKGYYNMLNQWLMLKQEGKSLEKYFIDNGYKTIAIYGMGEMGNRLYDELKYSSIVEVKYGIDKNVASTYSELETRDIGDKLEAVDVIVVTATFAFDEVEDRINGIVTGDIISLDDVVFGV